jgi:hypothetical protein
LVEKLRKEFCYEQLNTLNSNKLIWIKIDKKLLKPCLFWYLSECLLFLWYSSSLVGSLK